MGNARGGRARVPIEKRIQEGTYKPSRHGTTVQVAELVTDGLQLAAPRHFTTKALREAWSAIVDPLSRSGLLQLADAGAVEMAAVALVEFREAEALVRKEGLFVERIFAVSKDGDPVYRTEPNPALKIRDKAASEYRAWCARMGLTPSDRTALGVQQVKGLTMAAELGRELGPSGRAAAQ